MSELGLIEGNLTSVHQRNFLLVKLKPYLEDAPFATIETAWKRPYCAPERFWRCYGTLEITDIWLSRVMILGWQNLYGYSKLYKNSSCLGSNNVIKVFFRTWIWTQAFKMWNMISDFLFVTFAVQQTRAEGLHSRPHITRPCYKSHSFYFNA